MAFTLQTLSNGVQVVTPTPTGAGGEAINDNFTLLDTLIGAAFQPTLTGASIGDVLYYDGSNWINQSLAIANISGLQTALDAKAASSHTHAESDITDLGNYLENVSEDSSPELGGNLDGQGNSITNVGELTIDDGSISHLNFGTAEGRISYEHDPDIMSLEAGGNSFLVGSSTQFIVQHDLVMLGSNAIISLSNADISLTPNGTGKVILDGLHWPDSASPAAGDCLIHGSGSILTFAARLSDIVDDTTPQLGADLDTNGHQITQTETALGNLGATETIDWSAGSLFSGTLDSDVTITHSNETAGQGITLHLAYDDSAQRTITWTDVDVWEGGVPPFSPSSSGETLVVKLWKIGSTVYGSFNIFS